MVSFACRFVWNCRLIPKIPGKTHLASALSCLPFYTCKLRVILSDNFFLNKSLISNFWSKLTCEFYNVF